MPEGEGSAPAGNGPPLVSSRASESGHDQRFPRSLATVTVAGLAGALAVGAIGLVIWATAISTSVQLGRMVALTTIYSFGVAVIVPAVTMVTWSIRHQNSAVPGGSNRRKGCMAAVREPALMEWPIVIGDIPQEPPGFQPR